ncbi:MAG: chorismate synthase [Lentisphaerae bacterium]|jgi:chorismate synthase|nr:chorismate synthase [Lentisphaerota bacterium]
MSNTFGQIFRVTTFGESHGTAVGAVVDGCPAGLPLTADDIQRQLDRRRPGQSQLTTARQEADRVTLLSGVERGLTLGTPIALSVANADTRPADYAALAAAPRPSHADYALRMKYGRQAASGGGRASARETIGRVAAGAIAGQLLARFGVEIVAYVQAVGTIEGPEADPLTLTREMVDRTAIRCPDPDAAARMEAEVLDARAADDSVGGVVACICRGVPPGWGEPVFDKLDALLAHAMLSIPAVKGFEVGSGFSGTRMRGSVHNDAFYRRPDGRLGTVTNRSGGIQGGVSNGEPLLLRVAFKPTPTIGKAQETVNYEGQPIRLEAKGRHDPCVLPRAVPVVEAMAALVLADAALMQRAIAGL